MYRRLFHTVFVAAVAAFFSVSQKDIPIDVDLFVSDGDGMGRTYRFAGTAIGALRIIDGSNQIHMDGIVVTGSFALLAFDAGNRAAIHDGFPLFQVVAVDENLLALGDQFHQELRTSLDANATGGAFFPVDLG